MTLTKKKKEIEGWSSTDLYSMNVETGTRYLAEELCDMRLISADTVTVVNEIIDDGDVDDAQREIDLALDPKGLSLDFTEGGQWASLFIFNEVFNIVTTIKL